MLDEIRSQPQGIRTTIDHNLATARALRQHATSRDIRSVVLIGRGTSDNACTYAKYLFGMVNGLPAALAAPSLFNLYEAPLKLESSIVVAVSQSGETDEVVQGLNYAITRKALTVALTNEETSTLAQIADHAIVCTSGREVSIPATKTYTAQLTAAALICAVLAERNDLIEELRGLAETIARVLDESEQPIRQYVERFRFMTQCTFLGRGLNYATALEGALKLKETCSVAAESLSAADFLHGPIAALQPSHPVFVLGPMDATLESMTTMIQRLTSRRTEIVAVSDSPEILAKAQTPLPLPFGIPNLLWPCAAIVPLQLFSCFLALTKGLDPDRPAGLTKVTHSGHLANHRPANPTTLQG